MADTLPAADRAGVTNKVKRIEAELRTRNVEFEALPQANQPMAVAEMQDEPLVTELRQIADDYPTATAGKKSSMTTRRKTLLVEVNARIEARSKSVEPAQESDLVVTPATEPSRRELAATEAEATTATATRKRTSRRRS